jgi:hypothetical protein
LHTRRYPICFKIGPVDPLTIPVKVGSEPRMHRFERDNPWKKTWNDGDPDIGVNHDSPMRKGKKPAPIFFVAGQRPVCMDLIFYVRAAGRGAAECGCGSGRSPRDGRALGGDILRIS